MDGRDKHGHDEDSGGELIPSCPRCGHPIPCDAIDTRYSSPHILNTPNLISGIGALSAADRDSATTRRVSRGAMMPSSQMRAVAK